MMNKLIKISIMFVVAITISSCDEGFWKEVPLQETYVYTVYPYNDSSVYQYTLYSELSMFMIWSDENTITSYNEISDFVDRSTAKGDDDMFYDYEFIEHIVNVETEVTTQLKYTIVETDENRNYATVTVTNVADGTIVKQFLKATVATEKKYIDIQ